jgi:formylglycine-generating enzyme required for sulfatase activity
VYFKVQNAAGISDVASDTIFLVPEMLPVAPGAFTMGRTSAGDDAAYGNPNEDPPHQVTLGAYQIGKYQVTNRQYCDVLNWALAQNYLKTNTGQPWTGSVDIRAGGNPHQTILYYTSSACNIQYSAGAFSPKTRTGLPGATNYPMDTHPVEMMTWYGAVAFCNWLSQWQGLTPCYDMTTANWPLTVAPPTPGGYRLPTEAEWERAAAWDVAAPGGPKHWIYGFTSDTLTGKNRVNYYDSNPDYVNPLDLTTEPYTSPVGWFNGVNVSPNGDVATLNSVSPAGAYDMSGNVCECCGDWYSETYYSSSPATNPTGPATGTLRIIRGGSWNSNSSVSGYYYHCRTAIRRYFDPTAANAGLGFRLGKSTP